MNDMILCDIKTNEILLNEELKDMKKHKISNKCLYICRFILILFEELSDEVEYNSCNTEKIENSLLHDVIQYKINLFTKKDKVDYLVGTIQSKLDGRISDKIAELDEKGDMLEAEFSQQKADKDLTETIQFDLSKKLGRDATEDEVEEMKQKYEERMRGDEDEEMYDFDQQAKGEDVLDAAHYGDEDVDDNEEFFYTEEMEG